jgi:hypothetical protein
MKNFSERCIHYIVVCSFSLLIACNTSDPEISIIDRIDKKIAMEVYTHSSVIDQTEYLQTGLHDDFLHPDIVARLNHDTFLQQKLNAATMEENDTIFSYEEIPLVKESKTYCCIFQDGTLQSSTDHLTPFQDNTLFQLNENPPSEATRISKTVVKDGLMKLYNVKGDLIAEELFPVSNMKDFLDTMKVCLHNVEIQRAVKEAARVRDIGRIRKKLPEECKISQLSNGHVVLELALQSMPAVTKNLSIMSGVFKSKTELSEDMTRTLKFELFRGDYLVQRKTYAYSDKAPHCNYHFNDVISENPESIESEQIILNANGFPVLHHSKEFFHRNQFFYYFND